MAPHNKRDSSPTASETGRMRAAQTNRDVDMQGTPHENSTAIKVKMPEDFTGNRAKLTTFMAQAALYMVFNAKQFANETQQVLWVITLLKGAAFDWISPFLMDFMANKALDNTCTNDMKKETIAYFHTMAGFGKGIQRVFGDIEEIRTAEMKLEKIQQKGPATTYTAEFQQHATRTNWGEDALQHRYYQGLKDSVKDDLARGDKPNSLQGLISAAIKIDNRLYERSLERKGHYSTKYKQNKPQQGYSSRMEIDATQHKRQPSKEVMDKRRRDKLCFECGLPGHMASSHNKGPRKPWSGQKKQVNATMGMGRGKGYNDKVICATQSSRKTEPLPDGESSTSPIATFLRGRKRTKHVKQVTPGWKHGQRQVARFTPPVPTDSESETEHYWTKKRQERQDARELATSEDTIDTSAETTVPGGSIPYQEHNRKALWEPQHSESGSEESSEEQESDDEEACRASSPEPDWPKGYPLLGEHWTVCQREQGINGLNGSRQWQHCKTRKIFKEPGKIADGYGPDWGETYRVRYSDYRRIGWRQIAGPKTYMQHLPTEKPEFVGTTPQVGENWELVAQGADARHWMHTTKNYHHKEIYLSGIWPNLPAGQVFELVYQGRNHRDWRNVLTEQKHKEVCATSGDGHFNTRVRVGKNTLIALIDSGASANFISAETVSRLKLKTELKQEPYRLFTVNGENINEEDGSICVETEEFHLMHGKTKHFETIQMDLAPIGKHEMILGGPWLATHNPAIDWVEQRIEFTRCDCPKGWEKTVSFEKRKTAGTIPSGKQLCATKHEHFNEGSTDSEIAPEKYYREFMGLFDEELTELALPKHQSWDHKIELKPGSEPVPGPVYELSADDLGTLRANLDKDLAKGFIRESKSSARYPVLFAPKKEGPRRQCIDYRKLNDMTIKDAYALPLADELRQRLAGAKIFTQLDLRGAYNLIRIAPGHEWKTAFGCRYGHYEYTVMPFGLCNAPATMQRLINNVLRSYLDIFCIGYLDDILVYSQNEEEHVRHVKKVLTALQEHHLLLKPEKCHFHTKRLTFLGYVVTPEGLSMDPEKVKSVLDWEPPTNVTEVQSFLGFANYYRRFIQGYSFVAQPMTELTKKDKTFDWDDKCQAAFEELKRRFTKAPLLISFDPKKQIRLETDASDLALGAVISQPNEANK